MVKIYLHSSDRYMQTMDSNWALSLKPISLYTLYMRKAERHKNMMSNTPIIDIITSNLKTDCLV